MLEKYKDSQPIAYKTIKNAIEKNKFSHAYIIETNGYSNALDFSIAMATSILNSNKEKNELLELKVIHPDGTTIKKEQIEELQSAFSEKAIMGNNRVYIINGIEKMKETTSNSLLKFIEEPEEEIIGILITDNIYQIPQTIVSRCQLLSLKTTKYNNLNTITLIANYLYNSTTEINNYINDENSKENILRVIDFIFNYEKNHINTILYTKKLWHQYFFDRIHTKEGLSILLLFYKDALNVKLNQNIEIFVDYSDEINKLASMNTNKSLINKVNLINELKDTINYNVNTGLLLDKLIIKLEGCECND